MPINHTKLNEEKLSVVPNKYYKKKKRVRSLLESGQDVTIFLDQDNDIIRNESGPGTGMLNVKRIN